MKTHFLLFGLTVSSLVVVRGSSEPWRDPSVNSENRAPARAYSMPLASVDDAFKGELEPPTPYRLSLNGVWKFRWCGGESQRLPDFWKDEFDDSGWTTIDVPSCVEMRGWGQLNYTNTRYPFPADPPRIPREDNYVSSYRTRFTVPERWQGRECFLRFDGVGSAANVWVNGHKVGYTEDSYLPAEFKVTPFLRPGENLLAVEVFRRSDGSYLEDQDFFRFSGIFREVSLFAMPKDGIWDFKVDAKGDGSLKVQGDGASWKLYDAQHRAVEVPVRNVRRWSAEDPYLYTLVLQKNGDIRSVRIGFKDVVLEGNVFKINGVPVKFHGVNRHETNPANGRTVSLADMKQDILMMKAHNIDMVRTSHYPNHHSWYDLCDRYGVYVCAEANVEGHGMGYDNGGLGADRRFEASIVERNVNHVIDYRNHASIVMWSLGNETGHGNGFVKALSEVRRLDARPVHWERGNTIADMDSRMYPSVDWVEARGRMGDDPNDILSSAREDKYKQPCARHTPGKCFFMCEYAHAMGNAVGNLQEYWDVIYAHSSLCGGCIWDWADQAVWKTDHRPGPDGKAYRYLAYGGDFDDEPNSGPFCNNGLVDPLRRISSKLLEVKKVYEPLSVFCADAASGKATLVNRQSFTAANVYAGRWELLENGERVATGELHVPAIGARCSGEIVLPQPSGFAHKPGSEYFYNVAFFLKTDKPWAKAGDIVAREQLPWKPGGTNIGPLWHQGGKYAISETGREVVVEGEKVRARFCRETGTLDSFRLDGEELIAQDQCNYPNGPRLTWLRAFVDNDVWLRKEMTTRGMTQYRYTAESTKICREENRLETVVRITTGKSAGFVHKAVWSFGVKGSVCVDNEVTPFGELPSALPRLGLTLRLAAPFDRLQWYGRGPGENYIDRSRSTFIGRWQSTVSEQYVDYIRPQDCGVKTDVRWMELTDGCGRGFQVASSEPFLFSALNYDCEDLDGARHLSGERKRCKPLVPQRAVVLNLDCGQTGLGGNSCGPKPLEKYLLRPSPRSWRIVFSPSAGCRLPKASAL